MKKAKVILTGYRACGKTSIGRLLARRLGVEFLDMDRLIEERLGMRISRVVTDKGWDFFRDQERKLLAELVGRTGLVIAAGGGAIMHRETWKKLMETGTCVWLTADLATIRQRLRADNNTVSQRPSLTGEDPDREIEAILAERTPLYQQGSHLRVDTAGRPPEEIAAEIEQALKLFSSDRPET